MLCNKSRYFVSKNLHLLDLKLHDVMPRLRRGCGMIIEYFSGAHRGSSGYVFGLVYAAGIGPLSNTDKQTHALFEI